MSREITLKEVEKTLAEENIDEVIIVKRQNMQDVVIINLEEYKRICENELIEKLKKAEEQIKNGEVIEGEVVFREMRKKYDY